ncbi:hypothetical protein LINPERPRIM_LOCUS1535 [Linum perenne]
MTRINREMVQIFFLSPQNFFMNSFFLPYY